jgi:hypothetical protein
MGGDYLKYTKILGLSFGWRVLFFRKVEDTLLYGELYALVRPCATVYIVRGVIDPPGLEEFVDRGWNGFVFLDDFFNVDRLITKLPEMMFGIMLIAISEELELSHQPFLAGLIGVFGYSPEQLFG